MSMAHAWVRTFRAEAVTAQNARCLYCKRPITMRSATADHKWPKSRRGGSQRDNIAAACKPCNQAKGSRSHIEFFRLIDRREIPSGQPMDVMLAWATRRIWLRTDRACNRIERRAR